MSDNIVMRVTKEEKDRIRKLSEMQGETISSYCRKRCLLPWTHRELEGLGFGLVLGRLREKNYDDDYIKRFVGEMLNFLRSAPEYTVKFGNEKAAERERKELENEKGSMGDQG